MSVKAFEGGRIVLKNCSSESTVGGGVAAAGDGVDLYDCSFTQKGYYDWNSCLLSASNGTGVVNVYGGTYTGENYGLYIFSSGGDINFYNGDLKVAGDKPALKGDLDWDLILKAKAPSRCTVVRLTDHRRRQES